MGEASAQSRAIPRSGIERGAGALLLLLSALGLCTLAFTVAARVFSPWPLEWMEGASLQHALRLLRGEPLYAAPSADFIAYLYPPLAYAPMAATLALLGPSLPAARLASLVCSLGAIALLGRGAARAAGHAAAGWLTAGLFAVGFGYGGAFLDLARVDACFVLLVAAAAERLLAGRPRAALGWLVLSAFAKQHGVILLAAVSAALLVRGPRRAAIAVAASWLALAAAVLALQIATAGWFARYALELPLSHGLVPVLLLSFFAVDLLLYLPVLVLAAAFDLRGRLRAWTAFDALVLGALVAGALGRAHAGGHDNVRLPAFALLCIAGAVPLCRAALAPALAAAPALATALAPASATAPAPAPAAASAPRRRVLACGALLLQFGLLWQAPSYHAPRAQTAQAFRALRSALSHCARGGRAVALDYALLTGEPFVHTMALSDLRMGSSAALARAGTRALLAGLAAPDAPAAIAVGEHFPALDRSLTARYRLCAELPAPVPPTGYMPGAAGPNGKLQRVYARSQR